MRLEMYRHRDPNHFFPIDILPPIVDELQALAKGAYLKA